MSILGRKAGKPPWVGLHPLMGISSRSPNTALYKLDAHSTGGHFVLPYMNWRSQAKYNIVA